MEGKGMGSPMAVGKPAVGTDGTNNLGINLT